MTLTSKQVDGVDYNLLDILLLVTPIILHSDKICEFSNKTFECVTQSGLPSYLESLENREKSGNLKIDQESQGIGKLIKK